MSAIGWIDFSSEHRDKVHTVIDLLSEDGVIDELGIGVIRDSFADSMFPGISTIQTRPKYFTLTALLLKDFIATNKNRRQKLGRYLEENEKWCRIQLVRNAHERGGKDQGIIGGTFGTRDDRDVVRRASSIYWNGLRQFGFVVPRHLSLAEFGRRLSDGRVQFQALLEETTDERGDDHDAVTDGNRPRVNAPEVSDDYWDTLSIELNPIEADFLRKQITSNKPKSLLGQILLSDERMREVLQLRENAGFEELADLPFIGQLADSDLTRTVQHAQLFWALLDGAHIRYNCILQRLFGTDELAGEFEERWRDWRGRLGESLRGWNTNFMWQVVNQHGRRARASTRAFIEAWIAECEKGAKNIDLCEDLITRQEIRNKGNRARLRPGNKEAVNSWIGLSQVQYRFSEVRQLILDIHNAETGEGESSA